MTVTVLPWARSPAAASRPSRPPPTTTAARPGALRRASTSCARPEDLDVRQVGTRNRRHERPATRWPGRACRTGGSPLRVDDDAGVEVDAVGAAAAAQVDAVGGVPVGRAQLGLDVPGGPGQDLREEHAVVGRPVLLAEHRHPQRRLAADHLLDDRQAGHAGADDDDPLRRPRPPAPGREAGRAGAAGEPGGRDGRRADALDPDRRRLELRLA